MQLRRHPDWSFFAPQFPARDEVLAQQERRIARHPQTVFILAHFGDRVDNLADAGALLDRLPNVYMDMSAREAELGRQPFTARRFMIRYADRILFGTDRYPGRPDQPRHRIYYRMLETDDEYFDYFDHPFPPTGEWKIYGLSLPDDVLRRIYRENALRALTGQMPLTPVNPE
jgi:predicted TIM-barrel fold metal-dependent hydrolase